MQKIKIHIANRTYPLSVEEHQEETVRKSAKKINDAINNYEEKYACLLYTSPSPRDVEESRMPSSA